MTKMVEAVNGRTIITKIQGTRPLPQLKGVVSINSFAIGKNQLGPCIVNLFKKQGIDIKEIQLDLPAKLRLLAMDPSLEQRVTKGQTIDEIFSSLELSLFMTEDQNLYILGEKQNTNLLMNPLREESTIGKALIDLQATLGIENCQIRREAAQTLGEAGLKDEKTKIALLQKAKNDLSGMVRTASINALLKLGYEKDQDVIQTMLSILNEPSTDFNVREYAAYLLGRSGYNEVRLLKALRKCLKDPHGSLAFTAAEALVQLGWGFGTKEIMNTLMKNMDARRFQENPQTCIESVESQNLKEKIYEYKKRA